MEKRAKDKAQPAERSYPKKEKWLPLVRQLRTQDYWNYLTQFLSPNDRRLAFLETVLTNNDQIDPRVLYHGFRLIEGIMLWNIHQGSKGVWTEKKYSPAHVTRLLFDLTQALEVWDREIFQSAAHASDPENTRNKYKTGAQFLVAQAAPVFSLISAVSSPDVKAHSIRIALSLITESKTYSNHISSLLRGRAMDMGTKIDTGEDEFYDALNQLIASWNATELKEITKQLGDMLGIDATQNQHIHIPVTEEMMRLASLILANIRLHNQLAADFAERKGASKEMLLAARGPELGTEPMPALLNQLKKALAKRKFTDEEKVLSRQLFEIMLIEARLFNPAIILAIVETYGTTKLREALVKAYSRRDATISLKDVDNVLMYMVTGTFSSKLNHQVHALAEQGLQWLVEDLSETGLSDMLAQLIRSTAKFGLHSLNGINPLPQAYVFKPVADDKKVSVQDLNQYLEALNATEKQKIDAIRPVFREPAHSLRSIEGNLVANRHELSDETRESLKIRMRRCLEVENTLWDAVTTTLSNGETQVSHSAVALWNLSFTTCVNLLSEPESKFFQIDVTLVAEFASTLAQRITARYDAISKLKGRYTSEGTEKIKAAFLWSINQAAGHWSEPVVTALFAQIQRTVVQEDTHYFSGLIPDIVNAVTIERIPTVEGQPAQYRGKYNEKVIKLLTTLLIKFTNNSTIVGNNARKSFMSALSTISGDLTSLIESWTATNEYQWQTKIITDHSHQQQRDAAGVAALLNLLAGHIDGNDTYQKQLALAISKEIANEVEAQVQAEMPSASLIGNLEASRETLDKKGHEAKTKAEKIQSAAVSQLDEIKSLAKTRKLTLQSVQNLIKNSLSAFGATIADQTQLQLKLDQNSEAEPQIDIHDLLAALTQPYLTGNYAPEISPVGAMLAKVLHERFQNENLAIAPIAELRIKIATILGEKLTPSLSEAVGIEAQIVSETVLVKSMKHYFESADLFMAVEHAQLAKEDLTELKDYLERIKQVRSTVTSVHSPIEENIKRIRKNLAKILGPATHLIQMPKWADISGFLTEELITAITAVEKKTDK